jgi:hypothetical protein
MHLTIDQIERELKVIEKIDDLYLSENEHTVMDTIGYEARRKRKQELMTELKKRRPNYRV